MYCVHDLNLRNTNYHVILEYQARYSRQNVGHGWHNKTLLQLSKRRHVIDAGLSGSSFCAAELRA